MISGLRRDAVQDAAAGQPLDLGYEPAATARAVRALRDAASARGGVRWQGRIADGFDVAPLIHLPPPGAPDDGQSGAGAGADGRDAIGQWRARYRYGLCYCRLGPGFATVKDRRRPGETVRFVIDDPAVLDIFVRGFAILRLDRMDRSERGHVDMLWREGLLLRCADLVVTLPMRLRKWPVPYSAI